MKVTVIVPVLYSEPVLAQALGRLNSLGDQMDLETLVVVDVPDTTREEEAKRMNDAIAADQGARVLYRVGERGFGSALRYAFGQGGGDVLVPFMGDESDRAEDIPRMIEKLETGYDVVAGSRYMHGGKTVGMTAKQQISRAYSLLVRAVGGLDIHDVSNAFKAYRRAVVDTVRTEANSFDISVELTIKAAQAGFRIGEIPTTWTNRALGTSNFRFSREVPNYGRWLALAVRGRFASLRQRQHVPPQEDGP